MARVVQPQIYADHWFPCSGSHLECSVRYSLSCVVMWANNMYFQKLGITYIPISGFLPWQIEDCNGYRQVLIWVIVTIRLSVSQSNGDCVFASFRWCELSTLRCIPWHPFRHWKKWLMSVMISMPSVMLKVVSSFPSTSWIHFFLTKAFVPATKFIYLLFIFSLPNLS